MTTRLLAVVALHLFLLGSASFAQQPKPPPQVPRAVIADVKKLPGGGLLFAVRIYATDSKPLDLFRPPPKRNPNVPKQEGDDDPQPFSLSGSTLKDLYADKLYPCLSEVPREPFFGPMEITTRLNPGGWMQMGVAFPPVPPPAEIDGKKQPYALLFEIPELKIKTLLKLDPDTLKPI